MAPGQPEAGIVKPRSQIVVIIRRKSDGLFYEAVSGSYGPNWTDDVTRANFVNPTKVRSLIRIDWGRDPDEFEVLEVEPRIMNPNGFNRAIRKVCEERCREFGDPPCYELPTLSEPCDIVTPCDECRAVTGWKT